MEPTTTQSIQEIVVTGLLPLIFALLAWALKKGMDYIDAKTKFLDAEGQSKVKENAKSEIVDAVVVSVQATTQCYVDAIKKARADGRLTDEEKREARAQAKARAIAILKEKGLSAGEALLDATVEAIVGSSKNSPGDES